MSLIVACDDNYGIGKNGFIPWNEPRDLEHFKETTIGNDLIVGRITYEKLPKCVATARTLVPVGAGYATFFEAIEATNKTRFFIGGVRIYEEALETNNVDTIYLTRIQGSFDCDVNIKFIKKCLNKFYLVETQKLSESATLYVYSKTPEKMKPDEQKYLTLLKKVYFEGSDRSDRTGTGTRSVFGEQLKFDLTRFPLLTTKRTFWKGVAEELLWFVRGDTDANKLKQKNVGIWDKNSTREFLDKRGLAHREEGDLGPIYGFQWRHWNAQYSNMHEDYNSTGIDQLANIIKTIKNNPTDRRMIMTAWNPEQIEEMALPPCHVLCQFYVSDGKLSCHVYQRSVDCFLGLPFNIASYALLTYMISHVTNLIPGELTMSLGDTHLYKDHLDQAQIQWKREPYEFPLLSINPQKKTIDSITFEDLFLKNYKHHPAIKASMSA
jgi:dihydrofolate reductase/thymidylate synthase